MKQIIVFVIKDSQNNIWGVAPSKLQARVQIAWHLPKNGSYRIEPQVSYAKQSITHD
jgi:hypothetical protein